MSSGGAPLQFVPALPPEEVARANFYGLCARLLYAPPDAALLEAIAGADEIHGDDGGMALAWRDLARAAASTTPEAAREAYESAFVGTGKAPVTLYTSAYSVRYTNEVPLVELRADLAALGLARRAEVGEPEDHIAALCDVMRYLITERKEDLAAQKRFFERWIWPTVPPLCSAIAISENAAFYKAAAGLLFKLCTIEHSAFELF